MQHLIDTGQARFSLSGLAGMADNNAKTKHSATGAEGMTGLQISAAGVHRAN